MTGLTRKVLALGFVLCLAASAGCSSQCEGTVSGEVTLNGEPLKEGEITFLPPAGKGPVAKIVDGRFTARVPVGQMKVKISARNVVGKRKMYDAPDAPWVEDVEELLPARYNVDTKLTLTVQGGAQEKRFELTRP
jgi:hypothetical protein